MAAPHYRLQCSCIPLATVATLPYPQPHSSDSEKTTGPGDARLGQSLSPYGDLAAQTLGAHCLKAVYGHLDVASPPLCRQLFQALRAQTGAHGGRSRQRTPAVGVRPRPAPTPPSP